MKNEITQGDSYELVKQLDENSIDLLVTDPPYGISFMGKKWDKAVPPVSFWADCLRALKPGAFAFVMSLPRQDCLARMMLNLEEAGFVTAFTSLYWTFATGFPKAMSISKAVDKRAGVEREVLGIHLHPDGKPRNHDKWNNKNMGASGEYSGERDPVKSALVTKPETEEAKTFDGSYAGFQPKPAVEIILVAMKPLDEKTYIDQALANGKGVTWLDDCRIPINGEALSGGERFTNKAYCHVNSANERPWVKKRIESGLPVTSFKQNPRGRFPANLIVSDDALNDFQNHHGGNGKVGQGSGKTSGTYGQASSIVCSSYNDSGSYSRYFDIDAWFAECLSRLPEQVQKTFPWFIVPKPSKREKNAGLEDFPVKERQTQGKSEVRYIDRKDGKGIVPVNAKIQPRQNHHPTVKPITLASYLLTLGSRPGDVVLDPFCGSGWTPLACTMFNRQYVAFELEEEYVAISQARVEACRQQYLLCVEERSL